MLDWCSVCEKAIAPQKHTLIVPPSDSSTQDETPQPATTSPDTKTATTQQTVTAAAPPKNAATGQSKSTKRPTQNRATNARVAARKALTKAAEKDKEAKEKQLADVKPVGNAQLPHTEEVADSTAAKRLPPTTTGPRQRTVISQEPSALYCSEECRLKDEAKNILQLSTQQHNPLNPPWNHPSSLPSLYQSPSHQQNGYGYPSSPSSPPRLSGQPLHTGLPGVADWEAVNSHYFQRAFDPSSHFSADPPRTEDAEETAESRYRALLKATEDSFIPLPQLQHSLSTTRLTQLAAAKVQFTNRTKGDPAVITSTSTGGVGPIGNSSSDSVPSLSEDSHTTKADMVSDLPHQKFTVSPGDVPSTPSSHQFRPTALQMTALPSPPPTNRAPKRSKSKSKVKPGLTPSASQSNIPSMSSSQTFLPGSAPATTNSSIHNRTPLLNNHQPPASLHYGGVTTLDLYTVGYPLAFEPSYSRATQRPHSRTGSRSVISKASSIASHPIGEQITPTQSLLLPSSSSQGRPRTHRSGSGGSGSGSSRHADDDGLVMKKRAHHRGSRPRSTENVHGGNTSDADGFDTSSGVLVRMTSAFPVAISSSAPSRKSHHGTPSSFTGERDKTVHFPELNHRSSSAHSRHSRPSNSPLLHPLEEDNSSAQQIGGRSSSRLPHRRLSSHSSSQHRHTSQIYHSSLSSSPLSMSRLPSTDEASVAHPTKRSPSRLSESYVPNIEYEGTVPERPTIRRLSSHNHYSSPATTHIANLATSRSLTGSEASGWGWSSLSGKIRSITGLLQPELGCDRKVLDDAPVVDTTHPIQEVNPVNQSSPVHVAPEPVSPTKGSTSQRNPPTKPTPLTPDVDGSSTPKRTGSIGAGLVNLFGGWGLGITSANTVNRHRRSSSENPSAVTQPSTQPNKPASIKSQGEPAPAETPFSLSTVDLPRAKRPLPPLKVDKSPQSLVVIDRRTSPSSTSPHQPRRQNSNGPLTPASMTNGDNDGPQLIMPRSNWDPELVAKVKRERKLSREGLVHHHHHNPHTRSSGFSTPLYGQDTFEPTLSPPPTPSSAGRTSHSQFSVRAPSHHPPSAPAHLPRSKSNHSVSSMATTHYSRAPSERRPAAALPRGSSMTSLSQAAGRVPATAGLYHGHGRYASSHHPAQENATLGPRGGLRTSLSQPYVNRWFSTSPGAGGSAFGSPSGRGTYHPTDIDHPNGGLPAPPPNIYATIPGVAGQYGPTKKKKEKEPVPTYPVLTLPTGTRKKMIWTTIKLPDGTEEEVQVEGDEEEEVYPERKRLFFFDG